MLGCDPRFRPIHRVFGRGVIAVAACTLLFAGCSEEDVRSYRAPKDRPPQMPQEAPAARVTWSAPKGWESVPSDQQFRVATFRVASAGNVEVTITAFPGDAGGTLANVNRWRGQLGLPETTEQELIGALKPARVGATQLATLRLVGPVGKDMLGAIIKPGDGQTWFVKATTDAKAIDALAADFEAFARTFRVDAPAPAPAPGPAQSQAPGVQMSDVIPGSGGARVSPSPVNDNVQARLKAWTPPAAWQAQQGASAILAAAYTTSNDAGPVRITLTSLAGDGGGALMNINRWRDQLGLPPLDALTGDLAPPAGQPITVNLESADKTQGLFAVIVTRENSTWYFKATGSPDAIRAERPAIDRFVAEVGLGGAR